MRVASLQVVLLALVDGLHRLGVALTPVSEHQIAWLGQRPQVLRSRSLLQTRVTGEADVLREADHRRAVYVQLYCQLVARQVAPALEVLGEMAGQPSFLRGQLVDRKSTRLNSSHVKISYAVF